MATIKPWMAIVGRLVLLGVLTVVVIYYIPDAHVLGLNVQQFALILGIVGFSSLLVADVRSLSRSSDD